MPEANTTEGRRADMQPTPKETTPAPEPAAQTKVEARTEAGNDLSVMDLENKAMEALREVFDPELGMNVIELGLVRKLEWPPDNVEITMILTTPFCPYGPALIEQVREKVAEATQRTARVTMGLEMWDPSMMEDQAAANWGLYY